jgi:hypothetical protein
VLFRSWHQDRIHVISHQIVAAIGKNAVDGNRFRNFHKGLERIAGDPYKSRLSLLLEPAHSRNCLFDNLRYIAEFHIVCLEQIHIISAQAFQ